MSEQEIRNKESQRAHDAAVRLIADSRFCMEDWRVVINPFAEQNDCIPHSLGELFPDIVARHENEVVALGEVETEESVRDAEAAEWLELGRLCSRLYLFVPEGSEKAAADLIRKHGIACAGLRTYALNPDDTVSVESVSIPNGHNHKPDHPWWANLG